MKNLKSYFLRLVCVFMFTNVLPILSQDLVVTAKNDSINAQIIKEKNEMLHFYFLKDGEVRKTLLPLSEVAYYDKHYFLTVEVQKRIPELRIKLARDRKLE